MASPSPEEILQMSIAPALRSVDDYGQSKVDFAKFMLAQQLHHQDAAQRQAQAMAVLGVQHQNALALQREHDAAALERAKAMIHGTEDRRESSEKAKIKQGLLKYGVLPKPGETDDEYIVRAESEIGERAASVLGGFDDQVSKLDKKITAAVEKEQQRQAQVANDYAAKQFAASIEIDPKERAAISKLMAAGVSLDSAVAQFSRKNPERGAAIKAALDGFRLDGKSYAEQTMPKQVAAQMREWENQKQSVAIRANEFMKSPAGQIGLSKRLLSNPQAAFESGEEGGGDEPTETEATGIDAFHKALGVEAPKATKPQAAPKVAAPRATGLTPPADMFGPGVGSSVRSGVNQGAAWLTRKLVPLIYGTPGGPAPAASGAPIVPVSPFDAYERPAPMIAPEDVFVP